jgi:hypothetical protein
LLKNASFEQPSANGRIPEPKQANPANGVAETTWAHFQSLDQAGKLVVGLTNEISRTGKQSLFVDFAKAEKTPGAFLMSDLIPIKGAEQYRVSIWGRVDRKRPLTLDQRRSMMRLEVEFYQADQGTQTGDTEVRAQMVPGSPDRLLFLSNRWSEYFAEFKSPDDASFMKITYRWVLPEGKGETDGVIYFDDAVVEGVAGTLVPSLDPPATAAAPDAPATPQAPPNSTPAQAK